MKVFIACSSKDNVSSEYLNLASDVATMLVRLKHKLVFAGKDTGMMGKCFVTYKYEDGKTKAVLDVHDTDYLDALEVDAYEVEPSTFERTKILYQASDLILVLPGDIETFAEFMSILEEINTRDENKPIILFNYNNFYTPLLKLIENSYKQGFILKNEIKSFSIVNDLESLDAFLHNLNKER